ncbi:S9 family peptidase [Amycolatopsis panacis]|uniref:S9 family peptidase n=1 Tax=Amycolatopsis panacis TaxID=2340917 RepID=A0A419I817_9PSEU|nr:prolyl oligopeptidase family serine peptidase [Amycolatopsis panacis]RJQ88213.1 S9 family peptidase [Amycolatopsis panacis]
MGKPALPCGSWPTPLTSAAVTTAVAGPGEAIPGSGVFWAEMRPDEAGRTVLLRLLGDVRSEVLPAGTDVRSSVHEYGGGAWWLHPGSPGAVWYVDGGDQRVRVLEADGELVPLTPEPAFPRADRYADGHVSPDGTWLVAVRERHQVPGGPPDQVRNEVVRLRAHVPGEPEVLVTGSDFVAAPRISPDGRQLAWLAWDHPSMPWDDVRLQVRDLASGTESVVAGGPGEAAAEPQWQPDGSLTFLSDRTGWWNLYRWTPGHGVTLLVVLDAEIGVPGWALGGSRYAVLDDGRIVYACSRNGSDSLTVQCPDGGRTELDLPFTAIRSVRADGPAAFVCVAGSPVTEPLVYRVTLAGDGAEASALQPRRELGLAPSDISVPEPVDFPSVDLAGAPRIGHALYYPPAGPYRGTEGELPPLLVVLHGGPTAAAMPVFDAGLQYWTSRGFAVADVNYAGSSGYGRAYRELLRGAWGVLDVADCVAVARLLAGTRRVDPRRMAIRGSSAGGFTTLAALVAEDTPFSAGADHFGIADLEALAGETHKFESRYLECLIGPYPAERERYRARSPITRADRLRTPLIVLQGDEDPIVPRAQSEILVNALREHRVPVAYLRFPGEQHGFRQAANVCHALDAELWFYSRIFGFPAPPDVAPVEIENL